MNEVVKSDELVEAKVVIWESVVAVVATLSIILGCAYMLIVPQLQEDINELEAKQMSDDVQMEIRVRALEISDTRTGVHLVTLSNSIERLIVQLDKH